MLAQSGIDKIEKRSQSKIFGTEEIDRRVFILGVQSMMVVEFKDLKWSLQSKVVNRTIIAWLIKEVKQRKHIDTDQSDYYLAQIIPSFPIGQINYSINTSVFFGTSYQLDHD